MHDLLTLASLHSPESEAEPAARARLCNRTGKAILQSVLVSSLMAFSLCGCVGAWVEMPDKQVSKTEAHKQLTYLSQTPVITRTQKASSQREWCGATLLAVIVPVPLKLPVCESYNETSYGNDINGLEAPLLYSSQKISSPFYACGPFMFLGPIMHGYEGNAICGMFR